MNKFRIENFKGGWFIGDFYPTLLGTKDFEVAWKSYGAGIKEKPHYHKIATEYTIIVSGEAKMNGSIYTKGDIVVVDPGEIVEFEAMTPVETIVVKTPSARNDKYEQ